jgi:hypothetical protein
MPKGIPLSGVNAGWKKKGHEPWNKGVSTGIEPKNKGIRGLQHHTPETRKRISETSKEHWQRLEYRQDVTTKVKNLGQLWKGGQGQTPVASEAVYIHVLCRTGFVHNHIIGMGKGSHGHWTIDFAHLSTKIAVEIDGSSHQHRDRQERDARKDAYLRSLGWIVIRIKT